MHAQLHSGDIIFLSQINLTSLILSFYTVSEFQI